MKRSYRHMQEYEKKIIELRGKGFSRKDYVAGEQDTAAGLKHILARKDAQIKRLEMENELMRDFLSLTERK